MSLAAQWLGLHISTAPGMGSIPGSGTKILRNVAAPKKREKVWKVVSRWKLDVVF